MALGGGGGVGGLWRRSAQRAPRLLAVPSPHPTASFLMPAATKKGWGRLGLEKWGERARVGGCGAPPFLRSRARGAISLSHGAQAQGAGDEHAKAGPRSEGGTQRARCRWRRRKARARPLLTARVSRSLHGGTLSSRRRGGRRAARGLPVSPRRAHARARARLTPRPARACGTQSRHADKAGQAGQEAQARGRRGRHEPNPQIDACRSRADGTSTPSIGTIVPFPAV